MTGYAARARELPRPLARARDASLAQEPAGVVLLLHLLLRDPALLAHADVLSEPGLAVVSLDPGCAALLLQGVHGGPGGEAAEEGLAEACGLVDVLRHPSLVAVALDPVIVLLLLGFVGDALPGDPALEIAQGLVVAGAPEGLAELELQRAELEHEVVDLRALLVLPLVGPHAVAQALRHLRLLEAGLADPVAVLRLEVVGPVLLLQHPVDAVAPALRARGRGERAAAAEGEGGGRGELPGCGSEQQRGRRA